MRCSKGQGKFLIVDVGSVVELRNEIAWMNACTQNQYVYKIKNIAFGVKIMTLILMPN
jgi:hypothetical protein